MIWPAKGSASSSGVLAHIFDPTWIDIGLRRLSEKLESLRHFTKPLWRYEVARSGPR